MSGIKYRARGMGLYGRNDPCWCGSGLKYKRCHIDRAQQPKLERQDFEEQTKKRSKICSAVSLGDGLCTKKIVQAHTISKSSSLKQISNQGHVIGIKASISELVSTNGVMELKSVGINEASTFTGFCSYHDKHIFAPLEDESIVLSDEQLFLLAYRPISRELYAKNENILTAEFLKSTDRGTPVEMQQIIQMVANGHGLGASIAVGELENIKAEMDSILLRRDFSDMNHFVIELSDIPNILVSGSTQPEFDFSGARLQRFGRHQDPMSHLIYNAISYDNKGCFVFSWINSHDDICQKFIDSLLGLGDDAISTALVKYCYTFCENTWASPSWWRSIEDSSRNEIRRRAQLGSMLNPHKSNDLVPDAFSFNAFRVIKTSFRKSPKLAK
ncbi:SEC-C motif protein [Pseudomonas syringae pv. atrofaciens]|uniref:SEC-C metal-binding domain-containing protein n=1 Tax=Pseudomonas syringae TaxID=317 RepID=UPI000EFFCE52|nr:SEC-C motif protein [Pseudomonas syringae pv. atrofaciens]